MGYHVQLRDQIIFHCVERYITCSMFVVWLSSSNLRFWQFSASHLRKLMVTYCIPISVLFWAPKNQFFHEKIEKPMGKNGGVKLSKSGCLQPAFWICPYGNQPVSAQPKFRPSRRLLSPPKIREAIMRHEPIYATATRRRFPYFYRTLYF